jgi:quinol monooxygenase YgiN
MMAIAFVFDVPGMTQEHYEQSRREVGNPLEQGALVHVAGPIEGGWCVMEVWPSQESANVFFGSQKVQQILQNAGIPLAQPVVFSVHALYATSQQS